MGKVKKTTPKQKTSEANENNSESSLTIASEFRHLLGFEQLETCTLMKFNKKKGKLVREVWKDGKVVKQKNSKAAPEKDAQLKKEEVNGKVTIKDENKEKTKKKKKKKKVPQRDEQMKIEKTNGKPTKKDENKEKKEKKKKNKNGPKQDEQMNIEETGEKESKTDENKDKKKKKKRKRKKKTGNATVSEKNEMDTITKASKNTVKKEQNLVGETTPQSEEDNPKKKNKKRQKNNKKQSDVPTKKTRYNNSECHITRNCGEAVDVSAWFKIFTPAIVMEALAKIGFSEPTEIQKLTIPAAIKDGKDIIGAAETGSGKTLAFGIPIIHGILQDKQQEANSKDSGIESSDEEEEMDITERDFENPEEEDDEQVESKEIGMENYEMEDNEVEEEDDEEEEEDDEEEEEDANLPEGKIEELDPSALSFEEGDDEEVEEEDEDDEDNDSLPEGDIEELDPSELYLGGEDDEEDGNDVDGEEDEDDFDGDLLETLGEEKVDEEEGEEEKGGEGSELEISEEERKRLGLGCVKVIKNVKFDFLKEDDLQKYPRRKLRALIITPTRELAIQVNSHLCTVLLNTDIKTAVVVGGMSSEKQERLLLRGPDIVIGTPGRLWELIQMGNRHLSQLPDIRYLAIDETDRMLERGHFQELTDLLRMINSEKDLREKRQTFVFSATLTMVHSMPKRVNFKKKTPKMTSHMKIENLIKMIGIKKQHKVVDVTRKFGTAESLTEAKIFCDKDEKDAYLYYFLKQYPGRTLVFCNSIDCVRRLTSLFRLLECDPQALHASKQQKQRLKSLERFSSSPKACLIATDVAARGLDIPNIQHVLHYQVPRTAESYVHRSGRTARATQEGLSILFIDPTEVNKYRQLCNTLNREKELPPFPMDPAVMSQVKSRVGFAQTLEKRMHSTHKANVEEDWLKTMAREAGLELDDDMADDEDYTSEKSMMAAHNKRELKGMQQQLRQMLSKPLLSSDFSGKYPTHTGALVDPYTVNVGLEGSDLALNVVKKESEDFSKLLKTVKIKAPVKKENKKKMKGFDKRKKKRAEAKKQKGGVVEEMKF